MTENKPIKDGIDVSQCKCYSIKDNSCSDTLSGSCMKEKCQTFRLLQTIKAKTQECEELRTDIKDIANLLDLDTGEEYNFGNIEIAIKGLKQECERWKSNFNGKVSAIEDILQQTDQLKAENETYKKMLDNPEVLVALTDVRTGERDLWQKYKPRIEQAEQKLERIRQIVNKLSLSINWNINKNAYEKLQSIIQIIDEVE